VDKREKVLKGLKCCNSLTTMCGECPYYDRCSFLKKDALEVLEEMEAVVRCKDCKFSGCYTTEENGNIYRISCHKRNNKLNEWHKPDWYCADGERKEGR
jgi:hypothetical protein